MVALAQLIALRAAAEGEDALATSIGVKKHLSSLYMTHIKEEDWENVWRKDIGFDCKTHFSIFLPQKPIVFGKIAHPHLAVLGLCCCAGSFSCSEQGYALVAEHRLHWVAFRGVREHGLQNSYRFPAVACGLSSCSSDL